MNKNKTSLCSVGLNVLLIFFSKKMQFVLKKGEMLIERNLAKVIII